MLANVGRKGKTRAILLPSPVTIQQQTVRRAGVLTRSWRSHDRHDQSLIGTTTWCSCRDIHHPGPIVHRLPCSSPFLDTLHPWCGLRPERSFRIIVSRFEMLPGLLRKKLPGQVESSVRTSGISPAGNPAEIIISRSTLQRLGPLIFSSRHSPRKPRCSRSGMEVPPRP